MQTKIETKLERSRNQRTTYRPSNGLHSMKVTALCVSQSKTIRTVAWFCESGERFIVFVVEANKK